MKLLLVFAAWLPLLTRGEVCLTGGIFNEQAGRCYYFFNTKQVYEEAQHVCAGIGGRLVCIHNAFIQTLVYGSAKKIFKADDYWIGLAALDEPNVFEWADGVASSYQYWQSGYPSSFSMDRCVASRVLNGRWINTECDAVRKSFVCEVDTSSDAPKTECPGGLYDSVDNMCYYVMNSHQNYAEAEATCGIINGLLASVSVQSKQAFVYAAARKKSISSDYWIGLRDTDDAGNWQWSDGSPYYYENWESSCPIENAEMDCALVFLNDGGWYNGMCDDVLNPFVCQLDSQIIRTTTETTLRTTTTTTSIETTTTTPDTWIYFNQTGYYYKVFSTAFSGMLSWDSASRLCIERQATLTSIHSLAENNFVDSLRPGLAAAWIGMLCESADNCTWSDSSPIDYVNWANGYPANVTNANCGAISKGLWYNFYCASMAQVICKQRR